MGLMAEEFSFHLLHQLEGVRDIEHRAPSTIIRLRKISVVLEALLLMAVEGWRISTTFSKVRILVLWGTLVMRLLVWLLVGLLVMWLLMWLLLRFLFIKIEVT